MLSYYDISLHVRAGMNYSVAVIMNMTTSVLYYGFDVVSVCPVYPNSPVKVATNLTFFDSSAHRFINCSMRYM